jgi:hypothetical protein
VLNKIGMSMFLIAFWLVFPAVLMVFDISGIDNNIIENPDISEPTVYNTFSLFGDYAGLYFKMFFFAIPEWNLAIRLFLNFLQLVSLMLLILIIRGGV